MPRIRECLYEEKTHLGKIRYRFIRHRGAPKIGIKGVPGDPEFEFRYHQLLGGEDHEQAKILHRRIRKSKYDDGTWADLVDRYCSFLKINVEKGITSDGTYGTYSGILKRTALAVGTANVTSITTVEINQILAALTTSPATHNNMLKALRSMFKFAMEHTQLVRNDPTSGVKYTQIKSDGHSEWTSSQISQFLEHHKVGTTAHLAMTLLLYTACRRSDVVKLGPTNIKEVDGKSYLEFHQTKSDGTRGSEVIIPIDDHFMKVLSETTTGTDTFLVTSYGKPFTAKGFGNRVKKWTQDANLPDSISCHGIRKSIGSMMAEADCSNYQIMAVHGHSSPKASEVYTRKARRRVLAEQGQQKVNLIEILTSANSTG